MELRMKKALSSCLDKGIKIYLLWVRAHIGIKGNEEADQAANRASWDGDIRRLPQTATPMGIKAASKLYRSQWRFETSYGGHCNTYSYQALSAVTWMRTDKGPQKNWLHRLGKATSPACNCGHPLQNGHHITFHCPSWATLRTSLIGDRKEWAELDDPIWIKTGPGPEDVIDGGEEWFGHIFGILT